MPLRLTGTGSSDAHGYIEVFDTANNRWGHVCKNSFDILDAHIICKMLGFYTATAASANGVVTNNLNGSHFVLTDLDCKGTETSIFDCPLTGESNGICKATEIAGVSCSTSKL